MMSRSITGVSPVSLMSAPPASQLCHGSATVQTRRRDLRLAEDAGLAAQDAAPRSSAGGLDVHVGRGRLQLGVHAD